MHVGSADRITVERAAREHQEQQVTWRFCREPMGYVSGQAEDGHGPAMVLFRARNQWSGDTTRIKVQPRAIQRLGTRRSFAH
jgi:23S rRNA pseudouridine2604 synthase